MATKPFKLLTTSPGDTDIASQFPLLDRGDKDVLQSWINTDHNVDGTHTQVNFVMVGTLLSDGTTTTVAPTVAASRTAIFRDTDGALKTKRGEDSSVEFLQGVPPGVIMYYAGTVLPTGWLWCDGTSTGILRSTYARLFTAIGTTYGTGDGSTTFNLPDINGRLIIGRDRTSANRITAAGQNYDTSVLGGVGGVQNNTLIAANVPVLAFTGTQQTWSTNQATLLSTTSGNQNTNFGGNFSAWSTSTPSIAATTTITPSGSVNVGSANTAIANVPPSIVLNAIIRT